MYLNEPLIQYHHNIFQISPFFCRNILQKILIYASVSARNWLWLYVLLFMVWQQLCCGKSLSCLIYLLCKPWSTAPPPYHQMLFIIRLIIRTRVFKYFKFELLAFVLHAGSLHVLCQNVIYISFQWYSLQAYYFETLYPSLYQHCSINLTLAIKTRLSFNIIFLLRAVANIVLYSMRDRYDPFWHFIWRRCLAEKWENNGKRSLEDSKFMSFWRAEVRGGKEKNDG